MTLAVLHAHNAGNERGAQSLLDFMSLLTPLLASARRELKGDQGATQAVAGRARVQRVLDCRPHGSFANDNLACGRLADWQAHRVTAYIEDRLERTIHVNDLAKVARRSVAHFCRAFKRTFNATPHKYIIQRRIARARTLMLTTNLALSAVALSCGFSDQAHLSNLFRQSEGQTPALWRRRRREVFSEQDTMTAQQRLG